MATQSAELKTSTRRLQGRDQVEQSCQIERLRRHFGFGRCGSRPPFTTPEDA